MNYVKAIDKYLIVCFLFVFCSLLEYAIVLLLDRGKRKFEKEKNEVRAHNTSSFADLSQISHKEGLAYFGYQCSTDGATEVRLGTLDTGAATKGPFRKKEI